MQRGTTADQVAANVRTLRRGQQLDLADLSARLDKLGHPISLSGLSKLETGARRVDVDDLVSLAVALGVTPSDLLTPLTEELTTGVIRRERKHVYPVVDAVRAAGDASGLPPTTILEAARFLIDLDIGSGLREAMDKMDPEGVDDEQR